MERVFPNLYRFTEEPYHRGRKYHYLIVRKDGNLLIPTAGASLSKYFAEIEKLGGISKQLICHWHDAKGEHINEVSRYFGAKLYHHHADGPKLEEKVGTVCPIDEFGDEGLDMGTDFKAFYFPGNTPGHTIYHWESRGRYYLFTSHVVHLVEANWELWFNPIKLRHLGPDQFKYLVDLPITHALPSVAKYGREEYHQFNDYTRKTFATAIRSILRKATASRK